MAGLKSLGIAVFVLFTTTIACLGQRYTRYPGVQFAPPGSWSVACPSGVRCSSLYCAVQCGAARAKCHSFSYSASSSTCILAGQVFSLSSSFSVYDPQWSAYKQRKLAKLCGNCYFFPFFFFFSLSLSLSLLNKHSRTAFGIDARWKGYCFRRH